MIDLSRTRADFLAEIEALNATSDPLSDLTDSRIATADVHVRVRGLARKDLFPLLKLALSERFAAVARAQLFRDLLVPLKNVLGNAFKHGNGSDPAKAILVEMVLTRRGALIAVSDEGRGFDVARTFRGFQEQETYFVHQGSGFRNLHSAMSVVSYEHGGRTVLLCYRPMDVPGHAPSPDDLPVPTASEESPAGPRPKVFDSRWIQTSLSAEIPEFAPDSARIESCRIYATRGRDAADCGQRYLLRVAGHNGGPPETRKLIGRLHAAEAEAVADFEAATQLHKARISSRLRIPRPVARFEEPRLVLYEFDPWMNLWEYLITCRDSLGSLRHAAERVGQSLAALHRSPIVLPGVESVPFDQDLQAIIGRVETTLQNRPSEPDLANRFHACVQLIQEGPAFRMQRTTAPIHGALAWDCIHYGVDGSFYLYRFEKCRRSDPGLDLGGFAADLLCFTLAGHDDRAYRICIEDFLRHYNSKAEHPIGEDDLRLYIVFALCERLQAAQPRTEAGAGQLVAALEATLRDGPLEPLLEPDETAGTPN
jgi:hypothetical protein